MLAIGRAYDPHALFGGMELRGHLGPVPARLMDRMHNCLVRLLRSRLPFFLQRAREALGLRFVKLRAFANASLVWPCSQSAYKEWIRGGVGHAWDSASVARPMVGRSWPPAMVTDVFLDARRGASTQALRCSAGEHMEAYPFLRDPAATVIEPTGAMVAERRYPQRLCALLGGCVAAKREETPHIRRSVGVSSGYA